MDSVNVIADDMHPTILIYIVILPRDARAYDSARILGFVLAAQIDGCPRENHGCEVYENLTNGGYSYA